MDKIVSLLKMISSEIDEFFKASDSVNEVRSSDIYVFIRRKKILRCEFPKGSDFNHFLRETHKKGIMKQIISNYYVDIANYKYFQWYFYRKGMKVSSEIKSDSVIIPSKYYKSDRNIPTNNNDFVRSYQEQYIYNRLLQEDGLKISYEEPFGIKGYNKIPDFTIVSLQNKLVFRWEHFGMMNNPLYESSVEERIKWYFDKGYRFIEDGGKFIVTYYRNEFALRSDTERIIELIKKMQKKDNEIS